MKLIAGLLLLVSLSAFGGGTTGGGGNVEPSKQIEETLLIEATENSKKIVLSWLSFAYYDYDSLKSQKLCDQENYRLSCDLYGELFRNKTDIYAIVAQTQIENKLNGPCLDFYKQPNDGSIYGKRKGSICISISNLKKKLIASNYQQQISALILHEISHLLGANEKEASLAQRMMLNSLGDEPIKSIDDVVYEKFLSLYSLNSAIYKWQYSVKNTFEGQCLRTTNLVEKMYELTTGISIHNFRLLIPEQYEMIWNAYIKLDAINYYVCGYDPLESSSSRELSLMTYESAFNGKSKIKTSEFSNHLPSANSISLYMDKIVDASTFESEVSDVESVYGSVVKWFDAFYSSRFETYVTR